MKNIIILKKIKFREGAIIIITAILFLGASGGIASAGPSTSSTNSATCSYANSSFFDFPTWYQYLPPVKDSSGNCVPSLASLSDIWFVVAAVIEILLHIAALAAVAMVIYGGITYTVSMGNPETTGKAKKIILDAFIGLLISISASIIVAFLAGSIN